MKDITILPIFNQSVPGVWDDFLNIRKNAMHEVYNYKTTPENDISTLKELKKDFTYCGYNFAFGAYDKKNMIGFIQGNCVHKKAIIKNLYVLPDYMRQKVGFRLLNQAEKALGLNATSIELVSLAYAQKFYENNSFKPTSAGSNHYIKFVEGKVKCDILPMFGLSDALRYAYSKITEENKDTDALSYLRKAHVPVFVYLDIKAKVQGFVIGNEQGDGCKAFVVPGQPRLIKDRLLREFNFYKSSR